MTVSVALRPFPHLGQAARAPDASACSALREIAMQTTLRVWAGGHPEAGTMCVSYPESEQSGPRLRGTTRQARWAIPTRAVAP